MIARAQGWLDQYVAALRDYVAHANEANLERAYALGRQGVGDERAMLDLVEAHHRELALLARAASTPEEGARVVALAQGFFSESMSSFAMAQRGFRDTVNRLRDLTFLLTFQQAVGDAPAVAEVMERVVAHADAMLSAGTCRLFLPVCDGNWRRHDAAGAARGRAGSAAERNIIAQALQSPTPVVTDAATAAPPARRTGSHLAVALRRGAEVHGVLVFGRDAGRFEATDVALAGLMAAYAAQALGRAALLDEIRQQNSALEATNQRLITINRELEAFSYAVSHDLRAPLRGISGFGELLREDYGAMLDAQGHDYLDEIIGATRDMGQLIDALLHLSRVTRAEMRQEEVDLGQIARAIFAQLARGEQGRVVECVVGDDLVARGDARLLRIALENLLENAWKFTRHTPAARIEIDRKQQDGRLAYSVRDNGAGFDVAYADKLFGAFQRLHSAHEFEGTGIGLATVQRIIHRHGGQVWAEGAVGHGATFYFTLDTSQRSD